MNKYKMLVISKTFALLVVTLRKTFDLSYFENQANVYIASICLT